MKWNPPKDEHIVYEALSAIADNRFTLVSESEAQCYSTSRNKFYSVHYDSENSAIMSNDNMAFYVDEVSYPMVAMLLVKGKLEYNPEILKYFKDIKWKDINQRNKNNYMKSVNEVLEDLTSRGVNTQQIKNQVNDIFEDLLRLELNRLGKKQTPPKAY